MVEKPSLPPLDYQPASGSRPLRIWAILAAIPTPTLISAAYLTLTRWPTRHFTGLSDFGACILAVAAGAALLSYSQLRRKVLIPIAVVFVLVQFGWLVVFSLGFVCDAFGDCL
jgi:hypothetical protein